MALGAAADHGLGLTALGSVAGDGLGQTGLGSVTSDGLGSVAGHRMVYVLPLGVVAGLGAALLLLRHARQRLGGVTGDVLGALVETATAATLTVCALFG